jgi:hypothetical protein
MPLKRIFISCFFIYSFACYGQVDSIKFQVLTFGVAGTNGYAPQWIVNNAYGLYNDSINDAGIMPGFFIPAHFGKHFRMETGVDFALKSHPEQSIFYQAYFNAYYGKLKLMFGREKYTLGQYSDSLSSGSFMVSNNALPYPRLGIGFYDYVDLPFTHGYVQVKGALNHGWLEKDRFEHSAYSSSYVHEKFAFIRSNKLPVNIHFGLSHMAMYGGYDQAGNKIPYDFWSVFFARGSSVSGVSGEASNAYGEHLGIAEWGLNFKIKKTKFQLYQQKPITDSGGYHDNFKYNKDNFIGILVDLPLKIINAIDYEYINTRGQCGEGTPDPVVNGKIVTLSNPDDIQYLEDYYTSLGYDVSGFDFFQWEAFLEDQVNYGNRFGGRVDYYNNYLYRHIYKGRIIGSPLFHTQPQMLRFAGSMIDDPMHYVVNNRVEAHHLAFKGQLIRNLYYRIKFTYTRNWGSWQEYRDSIPLADGGRYKWQGVKVDPNYQWYYKGIKKECYTLFELNYYLPSNPRFSVQASMAWDFGDITNNFGGMFGFKYNGFVAFKKP